MQGSFRTIELSDSLFESQGLRFLTVKTPNLKGRGDICLYIPEVAENIDDLPIYILLHGVYGSAWIWAMKGGAHTSAKELMDSKTIKPAIIAMPSDGLYEDGSAYFSHHSKNYDQWIVNDVILAIRENIPQAKNSVKTCIGGLSMGGYGALSLGGRFPDKFKAISGLSSITKLEEMSLFTSDDISEYQKYAEQPNVIDILLKNKQSLPPFRFDCGSSDELIEGNRLLHQQLNDNEIDHIYEEFSGGHEWSYWIENVKKTYLFFNKYN